MFARLKNSGKHQYLQLVENRRDGTKTVQRVIATLGRLYRIQAKADIESIIKSLARFSEKTLLVLSDKNKVKASARKIGPALIFERLWQQLGIKTVIKQLLTHRKYTFDVERALFLTVLHRLFMSGSDRACDRWHRDYVIAGVDELNLHHLYRAMAFLGEESADQSDNPPFATRYIKDRVEENLFFERRDLFSELDFVFFDTTSIYFEGEGGATIGRKGNIKDRRPDLNQMVVGAVVDNDGHPLCCEMWPGNTADVKTLMPVTGRIRRRFGIGQFCIIADRGMISHENLGQLEQRQIPYIMGTRMRKVNEIKLEILCRSGRYRQVYPAGQPSNQPAPLKVKEVSLDDRRYIVCLNPKQARKDAATRQAIIEALEQQLKQAPKSLIGNKGYRRYLKLEHNQLVIDRHKILDEARFDGKWVLRTNTALSVEEVALKYKELWQVEQLFRDVKAVLEARPIFHQRDETIRGHVFGSFLHSCCEKNLTIALKK